MAEELVRATPLDAGWAALSEGDWETARSWFEQALAEGETPEALEGMGWVGNMLDEDPLTFDARERAYRLYLERGDKGQRREWPPGLPPTASCFAVSRRLAWRQRMNQGKAKAGM